MEGNQGFRAPGEISCAHISCMLLNYLKIELSKGRDPYTFYDGPPFATGLPHYGHLLASTIKDIIPRYWSMKGYHVERRFGWDTHGLPIEHEIDKKFGISGKDAVLKMGLDKYNAECRAIVMRYSSEWRTTIDRLGRWIDFDNDYKVSLDSITNPRIERH